MRIWDPGPNKKMQELQKLRKYYHAGNAKSCRPAPCDRSSAAARRIYLRCRSPGREEKVLVFKWEMSMCTLCQIIGILLDGRLFYEGWDM